MARSTGHVHVRSYLPLGPARKATIVELTERCSQ